MWESLGNDSCDVCQCATDRSKRTESSFDKENIQQALSPIKSEELSFYSNATSTAPLCSGSTSPNHCAHNIIIRRPLEDHDTNSRDSGYLTNYNSNNEKYSLHSPSNQSYKSGMDDDFLEDFAGIEPLDDNLPKDFNKLISGPIDNQQKQLKSPRDLPIRPLFRRALSLNTDLTTPNKVRSCLFKPDVRSFKRPEPPLGFTNLTNSKKIKLIDDELCDLDDYDEISTVPVSRPMIKRSFSVTEESIMTAVQKSSTEPDLIGDFSKTFCLPLTPGRHQDLKSITPQTLAKLIRGDFNTNIASFKVIDCRYPYEYEGGHINGAINIYTKDQCMELLNNFPTSDDTKKRNNILVFHCEFSSERGPTLCRYLRKQDRQLNQDSYPTLHYPEIYLLEGGYKNFFEQYSHLCVPIAYKEMLHPEHVNDLRYFRSKSKTWNVDNRQRPSQNPSKKLAL